jgi:hypothetical protein
MNIVVLLLDAIILAVILAFIYTARKRRTAAVPRRIGPPVPGVRSALASILFGVLTLSVFLLALNTMDIGSQWRSWQELRTATTTTEARVLAQQCIGRPRFFASENIRVTYQFEAALANGTRQIITQDLVRSAGKAGCDEHRPLPRSIMMIRYDPQNPSIAGPAQGPEIGGLIVGSMLGLVWLLLMSLLPLASGLETLLDMLDRQRANPLQAAQDEQERRELEAKGYMRITSPDIRQIVRRALQQNSPIAAHVLRHGAHDYLSFDFIADPARRARVWDLLWRYQAGHPLPGAEHQEVVALLFELRSDSSLTESLGMPAMKRPARRPRKPIGASVLETLGTITVALGMLALSEGEPLIGVPLIFIPLIYVFGRVRRRAPKQ